MAGHLLMLPMGWILLLLLMQLALQVRLVLGTNLMLLPGLRM